VIDKIWDMYGEDIKEFQWLLFIHKKTGKTVFPYNKNLDPFVSMGWVKRQGDEVDLGSPLYIGELFPDTKKGLQTKQLEVVGEKAKSEYWSLRKELAKVLELPADFHVNPAYHNMLAHLSKKYSPGFVRHLVSWYDTNREKFPKQYQRLRFNQFCSEAVFLMIKTYEENGFPKPKESPKQEIAANRDNYGDRVC
jgi:hypothetical protein